MSKRVTQTPIAPPNAEFLPLDVPRQIALKGKTQTYKYFFRRLTDADWKKYFSSIINQVLQVDGQRERVYESESAGVDLVNGTLVRVDGYGDLDALKDWKESLPVRHRIAVAMILRSVGAPEKAAEPAQLSDQVEVTLEAVWPTEGENKLYKGLVHRFRHLSAADLKKFNFESARVRVRGDGTNSVSTYPSRQLILMSMYDELIEGVDGYSVAGSPLTGVESIKREMDGAHKAAAVLQLFEGEEEVAVE